MAISDTGGNVENYMVGKGRVYFTPSGGSERDLGNVTEFEFTPNVELLDHYSSRFGTKKRDRRVAIQQTASVKITMDEWTGKNAAMMLMADEIAAFSLATTADTADGAATLLNLASVAGLNIGQWYKVAGAGIPAGAMFIWDGDTGQAMIDDTGAAVNATATATGVNVTITAPITFDIFSLTEVAGALRFEGTNDIGPRLRLVLPNVTFTPSAGMNPISDEWGTMEMTGDVLADSAGSFGKFYWNTAAP